jgi:DNA replication and repair protein RecF
MGMGETLSLAYSLKDESITEEALTDGLANSRHVDIARGGTNVGPHRDDLQIDVSGREGRLFGSQGQQRTAVISLKLATLDFAQEELGLPPMLLLDDILSDLDERRRALLVERILAQTGQAVLTCTEASAAGEGLLDRARVFHVLEGQVQPA